MDAVLRMHNALAGDLSIDEQQTRKRRYRSHSKTLSNRIHRCQRDDTTHAP